MINGSSAFSLEFDGSCYTIANLGINRPDFDGVGLFGGIVSRGMRNIGLVNMDIGGREGVGGIVGSINVVYNVNDVINVDNVNTLAMRLV